MNETTYKKAQKHVFDLEALLLPFFYEYLDNEHDEENDIDWEFTFRAISNLKITISNLREQE